MGLLERNIGPRPEADDAKIEEARSRPRGVTFAQIAERIAAHKRANPSSDVQVSPAVADAKARVTLVRERSRLPFQSPVDGIVERLEAEQHRKLARELADAQSAFGARRPCFGQLLEQRDAEEQRRRDADRLLWEVFPPTMQSNAFDDEFKRMRAEAKWRDEQAKRERARNTKQIADAVALALGNLLKSHTTVAAGAGAAARSQREVHESMHASEDRGAPKQALDRLVIGAADIQIELGLKPGRRTWRAMREMNERLAGPIVYLPKGSRIPRARASDLREFRERLRAVEREAAGAQQDLMLLNSMGEAREGAGLADQNMRRKRRRTSASDEDEPT
jgi:hypothetical protein